MKKYRLVFFIIISGFYYGNAQVSKIENPEVKTDIIPYRPKLAEFTFNNLYDYKTSSRSEQLGSATSEVERDTQMKIRLGIPIIIKHSRLFGVQLKYDRHNFRLDPDYMGSDYELYDYLENHILTSLGGRFIYQTNFDNNKEITAVVGAELKSDEIKWRTNTTKYYAIINYDVTLNDRTKIGTGLSLGYSLGRPQIYPLFSYEHKFTNKWTLDLNLPKSAAMRYMVNDKFYITGSAEVKGWRYAISNSEVFPEEKIVVLKKSDVYIGLSFEHEIYDWLWAGFDTGMTVNLRNYLARPKDRSTNALIDLKPDNAVYARFGLFIVPPRSFYK